MAQNKTILDKTAFANSLAILMIVFYVILYVLYLVTPSAFTFFFNAQFLGADVASLLPQFSLSAFIGTLVVLTITCWIFGYAWAGLYNRLAK